MAAITKGMAGKRRRPGARDVPLAFAAVTAIALPHAQAADWKFSPRLELRETYTDNVRLAPLGAERSDFVTEVSPGFRLEGNGRGLKLRADYQMQNLHYARSRDDLQTNHLLNATGTAEMVRERVFVDARASVSQQTLSPFGAQSVDNTNLTDNRTEVRTLSLSPYLRHRFGSNATSELRYSRDSVTSSARGALDSDTDRILLKVDSGPAFRTLGWNLNYNWQHLDYKNANAVTLESASGTVRYHIQPRLSLNLTGGYESNDYPSILEKPQGFFWLAGATWTPTLRTYIDAKLGNRFYGRTYALTANHRMRQSVLSIGYSEDITTTTSQFAVPASISTADFLNNLWSASIPDAQVRQQIVDNFIRDSGLPTSLATSVNTVSNRVFLQKSLQASLAFTGARHTGLVSLFNTERRAQTPSAADAGLATVGAGLPDDTRQTGINAVWNWRLGPRTSATANAGYTRAESPGTGRKDNNKIVRLSLGRQLQPKLRGLVEVRRQVTDSNVALGDRKENAVTASLALSY